MSPTLILHLHLRCASFLCAWTVGSRSGPSRVILLVDLYLVGAARSGLITRRPASLINDVSGDLARAQFIFVWRKMRSPSDAPSRICPRRFIQCRFLFTRTQGFQLPWIDASLRIIYTNRINYVSRSFFSWETGWSRGGQERVSPNMRMNDKIRRGGGADFLRLLLRRIANVRKKAKTRAIILGKWSVQEVNPPRGGNGGCTNQHNRHFGQRLLQQ